MLNSNLVYFHIIGGKIIINDKKIAKIINSLKFFLFNELKNNNNKKQEPLRINENFAWNETNIIINDNINFWTSKFLL